MSDESIIIAAGEWLLNICSKKTSLDKDQLLTRLEQVKFDEFFTLHGKSPVFKEYHVESVRAALAKHYRPDYQLARALLDKDDTGRLFVGEKDLLQVAIKTARVQPDLLGQDPKTSCPELLEVVKLLMAHGASVDCIDDDEYSPLVYTCILGYEDLFRFLIACGADISTVQKRLPPEQLKKARESAETPGDYENEQANLLQVTLDALISPQRITDMTWIGWPPGVNFDIPLWESDIPASWGGIVLYLLGQGLSYSKDDPGLVMLLHIACFTGSLDVVQKLLDYGAAADVAGPRIVDGGQGEGTTFGTAMHAAAAGRKLSVVSELISRGESSACLRFCKLMRGPEVDSTPVRMAITAARCEDDESIFDFVEDFMSQGKDFPDSDYQDVLEYCVREKKLDAAKRLLERGIRLTEVPIPNADPFLESRTDDSDVEIVKLLVSYGIKLDPEALQVKALKRGQVELLRWCVNEYGPLLPSDPKSWGKMVAKLFDTVRMEAPRYLINEYPGPHIDTVLMAKAGKSRKAEPQETSWLHLALVRDRLPAIRLLLEAGADPTCPGLPLDATTTMRGVCQRQFRQIPERLEIIRILEKNVKSIPSYDKTRALLAETVAKQRRAWDEKIEDMVKNRQEVPTQKLEHSTPSSPLAVGGTSGLEIYQPLSSSSSFRLLELLPSESRTDPLVGRLIDSDITFQPDYEALSYVWGDITPVRYINLGDQDVSITPNLHSALVHLRSSTDVRTLWVDALCINQFVHGERNQQVRIMGDVYKSARQVVVWLGESADDSHLVFEHIKDETVQYSEINPSTPPENKRRAWSALVRRPWFFRTWVIQEIALAKKAVIMCGDDSAPWKDSRPARWDFSGGAKGLSSVDHGPGNKSDHPIQGFDADRHVCRLRLLRFGDNPMNILRYSRVCQTTEIRDRIYGILGLFQPGFIPVDYDLPIEDIFRQFTEAAIQLTGDLRILRHLGATRAFESLPSWVPDYTDTSTKSLPENNWHAPYRENAEANYDVRAVDGSQYSIPRENLGDKFLPGLRFLKDGGLVMKGKMVDTIREVGPELPEGVAHAPGTEAFAKVMRQWESLASTLIPGWKLSSSVTKAFSATISATHGSELFSLQAGFTQWYRHCGTGILEAADPSMSLRDYEFYIWWLSVGKDKKEEEEIGYHLRRFSDGVFFASYGRCLFTTEGGTMGLASPKVRKGDQAVYFPGSTEPFVLRRGDKGWMLVNDCYLYGLDLDLLFHNSEHLVEDFVIH